MKRKVIMLNDHFYLQMTHEKILTLSFCGYNFCPSLTVFLLFDGSCVLLIRKMIFAIIQNCLDFSTNSFKPGALFIFFSAREVHVPKDPSPLFWIKFVLCRFTPSALPLQRWSLLHQVRRMVKIRQYLTIIITWGACLNIENDFLHFFALQILPKL